jgi:transaldolase
LYVETLVAPFTISTMPDKTLLAFADHGRVDDPIPADGGDAEEVLREFVRIGIDQRAVAAELQRAGGEAFTRSWRSVLHRIDEKAA